VEGDSPGCPAGLKVLARSGQFPGARTPLDGAGALVPPASRAALQAGILTAEAEADRARRGAPGKRRPACAQRCTPVRPGTPPRMRIRPWPPALAGLTGHPGAPGPARGA
jgi:hypothetical protein